MKLRVEPADRASLEAFFGQHGKLQYCWCARWRLRNGAFSTAGKAGRKRALLEAALPPGLLAHLDDGTTVSWVSVAPRVSFDGLERSRALARPPEVGVWAVTCVFVASGYRRQRVPARMLREAASHAITEGAVHVEGYAAPQSGSSYRYMGLESQYRDAGFEEHAVLPNGRRVMRYAR